MYEEVMKQLMSPLQEKAFYKVVDRHEEMSDFTGFTTHKDLPSGDGREPNFIGLVYEMIQEFVEKGGDLSLPYEVVSEGNYIIIRQEKKL